MNIEYIRAGDYYIPNLKLPKKNRVIGKWGRMHRDYLKEYHPIQFNNLVLSGNFWTYLADLNEQAPQHTEVLIKQIQSQERINGELNAADLLAWVQCMNNIHTRAEETVSAELTDTCTWKVRILNTHIAAHEPNFGDMCLYDPYILLIISLEGVKPGRLSYNGMAAG